MSDFRIPDSAKISDRAAASGLSGAAIRRGERKIAIDVGESSTKAEISRGGFPISEIPVRDDRIASFLDDLIIVPTKIVTQTIPPGTAVARGTAIDVVLARTNTLPVSVIPGAHVAFADLNMGDLHSRFAGVAEVRDLVRTKTASELTAAERTTLSQVLQANNVPVGTAPGETPEAAFIAIQAAFTFQG